MSRRKGSVKRPVLADARYDSQTVSKFINNLMERGKKGLSERVFYSAMDMPGHQGAERHTELGLRVVRVDADRNLLFVRGAVPGSRNGIVTVAKQGGRSRYA